MTPFSRKHVSAFEAVVYIALHHSASPISGKRLADVQGLPPRYLEQIMQRLVHQGILRSIRGPRGGYVLAKERRKITIADICEIIQQAEEEEEAIGKTTILAERIIAPYCCTVKELIETELSKTTLADLCDEAHRKKATDDNNGSNGDGEHPEFMI